MASVGGVSSSNASSIYGNRNVISGLASGMDTESMIENAVSGIKKRISGLGQKRTTWEWKQEAYRSIISKMGNFASKYTSFNSSTNLYSSSFFTRAVITTANGSNASKVSATGKSTSDIKITGVKELATVAKAIASGGAVGGTGLPTITAGSAVNLQNPTELSKLSGSITVAYGGKSVDIDLDELDILDPSDPAAVAKKLTEKLSEQKIVTSSGDVKKASDLIRVSADVDTGEITFSDKSPAGNAVYISSASQNIKDTLGLGELNGKDVISFSLKDADGNNRVLSETTHLGKYLSGKEITVSLDGVNKKIKLPTYDPAAPITNQEFVDSLNTSLKSAFGTDAHGNAKVSVKNNMVDAITDPTGSRGLQLEFSSKQKGSTLVVSSKINEKLGLKTTATSYQDTGAKLGELVPDVFSGVAAKDIHDRVAATGKVTTDDNGVSTDATGRLVKEDTDGKFYLWDDKGGADGSGEYIKGYDMYVNDIKIGTYTKETSLDTLVADINNNTEAGVSVSFSKTTNQFSFSAKESGAARGIKISGGLAENIFGRLTGADANGEVRGTDAVFSMIVNGNDLGEITRSTNTFDVDGMNITLNGKFDSTAADGGDAVTFTSKSDADKIVTAITDMVKDYNEMMKEIKSAYTTMPAEKSKGVKYQPLTDEDKANMSESAIEAYEELAKQGVTFADSDLSSLYNKMRSVFSSSGADGTMLRAMGISTEYSATDGTTATLDEKKLRSMLETNPDAVKDAFTKSKENGAATDGVMSKLKAQLDNYAGTTGATKGLLIEKAGSPLSPTSMLKNTFLDAMTDIDKEIERWETKLSDSVDRYTRQFSQLEQLIAQMNSQSSSLMGMMGGGG